MKISELVYVGIAGSVVALNHRTGELVWATRLKGGDFVTIVLEEDRIFAAAHGEILCLDALNGKILWQNPLKGYGRGLASIVTEQNPGAGPSVVFAEKRRRDQQQAASGAAATM